VPDDVCARGNGKRLCFRARGSACSVSEADNQSASGPEDRVRTYVYNSPKYYLQWRIDMTITHERLVGLTGHFKEMPKIVVLCGSTRCYQQFQHSTYEETMAGHIVLSVGFYTHRSEEAHGEKWGCTPEQKIALDELHKRKIDLADEVLVLNVGGYIGDSTRSEIVYAQALGMTIRYLEPL
jgi:hypothetical protein